LDEKQKMSRRRFLALAGGTVGVTTFLFRFMLNAMKVPEGDYRNWNAIRAWATNVGSTLLNA
jgi:hypothetical protein